MGWLNCPNQILRGRLHWKSLLPSAFLCSKSFWVVLIKNDLGLETFFLQNGLSNTPPNSIKFHQFHGTELDNFLFRLCVESYISHVIISSHSNNSASKYFINDLRQNSLNLVSIITLNAITMNYFLSKTDNWLPIASHLTTTLFIHPRQIGKMKEWLNTSPILGKACYRSHRSWIESNFYMINKNYQDS